jgi:hypothetical protein
MDRSEKRPGRKRGKRSGSPELRAEKLKCFLDTDDTCQVKLAEILDCSADYVYKLIRCERDLLDKHIKKICEYFRIDSQLFDDEVSVNLFKIKILPEKLKLSFVVPHNLPREDHLFIGRKTEMDQLAEYLSPENQEFRCAITGMGGAGKSALALKCAWQCVKEKSFEAVVWLLAQMEFLISNKVSRGRQSRLNFEEFLTLVLSILDEESSENILSIKEQRKIVMNILARKRTLLIIDNYEDVEDDEIETFLSQIPNPSKVLVTDRRSISEGMIIPLSGLSFDESKELVLAQCNKRKYAINEHDIAKILSHIEGNPLAIDWIVGLIANQNWNIEKITSHLGKKGDSHLLEFIFSRAWDSIPEISKKILLYFAMFSDGTTCESVANQLNISEDETNEYLIELLGLSLLVKVNCRSEKEPEFSDLVSIKNCFKILPLTKYFVRKKMEETEYEITNTANRNLHELLYENQISPAALPGNVILLIKNNIDRLISITEAAFVSCEYDLVINLAELLDPFLRSMEKHDIRLSVAKMSLDSVGQLNDIGKKIIYTAADYEKACIIMDHHLKYKNPSDDNLGYFSSKDVSTHWSKRRGLELKKLLKVWKSKIDREGWRLDKLQT